MPLAIFYFTSYRLDIFRALLCPSSGACDYDVELPHWSFCNNKFMFFINICKYFIL